DVVEQRERVGGVVGHRRLALRHARAAEPALVVHEHVELLGEPVDQHSSRLDGGAGAVDEQQVRTVADLLVVQVEIGEREVRHGQRLVSSAGTSGSGAPSVATSVATAPSKPTVYDVIDSEPPR